MGTVSCQHSSENKEVCNSTIQTEVMIMQLKKSSRKYVFVPENHYIDAHAFVQSRHYEFNSPRANRLDLCCFFRAN